MAQTEVPETDGPETDGAETDGTDVSGSQTDVLEMLRHGGWVLRFTAFHFRHIHLFHSSWPSPSVAETDDPHETVGVLC